MSGIALVHTKRHVYIQRQFQVKKTFLYEKVKNMVLCLHMADSYSRYNRWIIPSSV